MTQTTTAMPRNGMATEAEELFRDYQAAPTPATADKLIDLIPALVAEIDEAQRWALMARRHREAIQARLRESRDLINRVRDHVGGHDDGEVDVWSLRELLAGREPHSNGTLRCRTSGVDHRAATVLVDGEPRCDSCADAIAGDDSSRLAPLPGTAA